MISSLLLKLCGFRAVGVMRPFSTLFPFVDEANKPCDTMANPFQRPKQQCVLCKYKIKVDYKNTKLLSQFQSPFTGRVYQSHITGLCKRQQELVEKEIVKAQFLSLMPYMMKDGDFLDDPPLFDPNRPIRPHRFE